MSVTMILLWIKLHVLWLPVLDSCDLSLNNQIQNSNEATQPYTNYLYASNASIPGRIYMTLNSHKFKPCINTVTSFFNKHHTCSNCEDFRASPEKWNFIKVTKPQIGDVIIQHDSNGKAYHAVLLVDIKNGDYYVNHAVLTKYYKNVKLKNKNNLTFYRYIEHGQ